MLRSRLFYAFLALLLLGGMAFFAFTNPSYEKAFEAKWYYLTGEYDKAYKLAKEAYKLDIYNRMAFTIMTQTGIARKYIAYIKEGKRYLKLIETIANHPPISKADRVRIKLMCEIMIGRYKKLAPTKLTDKDVVTNAKKMYDKFKDIDNSLFK